VPPVIEMRHNPCPSTLASIEPFIASSGTLIVTSNNPVGGPEQPTEDLDEDVVDAGARVSRVRLLYIML